MTHTFYKKCSEKPHRIGRRNASHIFYKKCAGVRGRRVVSGGSEYHGCDGEGLHTFYKKCAEGRGAGVSRAYVTKVFDGKANFTFASPLLGHRLWRLAPLGGYSMRFANARALERRYRDRLRRPTLRSKASSAHLRMDFIPQLVIKVDDGIQDASNLSTLQPFNLSILKCTP